MSVKELTDASCHGHVEVVKELLADPLVDANQKFDNGWTALHFASEKGHVEVVKVLLAHPLIDFNQQNNERDCPSHCFWKWSC